MNDKENRRGLGMGSAIKYETCKVNEFEVCIGVSIINAKYANANVELTYVSAVRADCQFCLSIFILWIIIIHFMDNESAEDVLRRLVR